jgi:hypothetical protein
VFSREGHRDQNSLRVELAAAGLNASDQISRVLTGTFAGAVSCEQQRMRPEMVGMAQLINPTNGAICCLGNPGHFREGSLSSG